MDTFSRPGRRARLSFSLSDCARCSFWPMAVGLYAGAACAQSDSQKPLEAAAPEVQVIAPRLVTPLPGIYLERGQTTTNVQSATGREIEASKASTLTDFMNNKMQSINVNDYQGNPYQQDLSYRGFSASPQIGTPQGLSVYVDGVRVNEAFGEVVNWDLLPMNAIQRMDLMPGSNPLFGLNTLGGALAISTKSGFSNPGVEAQVSGGSFGRRQVQASVGANNGTLGAFVAVNGFNEDGWRVNSPSQIRQLFAKGSMQGRFGELGLTLIHADNSLVGNGMVPIEIYQQQRNAVFTSPDQTDNRLTHLALNGRLDLSETTSVSAMAYQRQLSQRSIGGDFYDEWDAAANGRTGGCPDPLISTFPDGATEVNAPGCPGVTPNGVFNFGTSNQKARGATLQYNWASTKHQVVLGTSYDTSDITFIQNQRLGWIGPNGTVYLDPSTFATVGLTPLIQRRSTEQPDRHFLDLELVRARGMDRQARTQLDGRRALQRVARAESARIRSADSALSVLGHVGAPAAAHAAVPRPIRSRAISVARATSTITA